MRSNLIKEILANITPEQREKFKNPPPRSLDFELGILIGDLIMCKFMPYISTDWGLSRRVIKVTKEETEEEERLSEIWSKARDRYDYKETERAIRETEQEWNDMQSYRELLQEKYMPNELECYFPSLFSRIEDMNEFKEGIYSSLEDSDCCSYDCEPDQIRITEEDGHMMIYLKRSKWKPTTV